jgi:hypothetical protein
MMYARRQQPPQYVDPFLLMHLHDFASVSVSSARRSWWLIVSLTLAVALLFSFAGALLL